jgi:hypothetical protein
MKSTTFLKHVEKTKVRLETESRSVDLEIHSHRHRHHNHDDDDDEDERIHMIYGHVEALPKLSSIPLPRPQARSHAILYTASSTKVRSDNARRIAMVAPISPVYISEDQLRRSHVNPLLSKTVDNERYRPLLVRHVEQVTIGAQSENATCIIPHEEKCERWCNNMRHEET